MRRHWAPFSGSCYQSHLLTGLGSFSTKSSLVVPDIGTSPLLTIHTILAFHQHRLACCPGSAFRPLSPVRHKITNLHPAGQPHFSLVTHSFLSHSYLQPSSRPLCLQFPKSPLPASGWNHLLLLRGKKKKQKNTEEGCHQHSATCLVHLFLPNRIQERSLLLPSPAAFSGIVHC